MSAAGIFWSAFVDGLSFGGNGEIPGVPKRLFRREAMPVETVRTREASREEIAQLVEELWRDRARTGIVEQIERRLAG